MTNSPLATKKTIGLTSDNIAGVSPQILQHLIEFSVGDATPYGNDELSLELDRKMSTLFETEVAVVLVPTGTAANSLCLAAMSPAWGRYFVIQIAILIMMNVVRLNFSVTGLSY